MQRTLLSIIVILFGTQLFAQQDHFVFIQEPSGQPFYVRIGEESHSSSSSGHLILAPMKDSVYDLYVGFPKNKYPEQLFSLPVRKDLGFELKNANGMWQLFDLQGLELIRPVQGGVRDTQTVRKTDSYSQLMAGVVNDTAVLYSEKKTDSVMQEVVATEKKQLDSAKKTVAAVPGKKKGSKAKAPVSDISKGDSAASRVAVASKVKTAPVQDSIARVDTQTKDSVKNVVQPALASDSSGMVHDRRDIVRYLTENVVEGKLMIYLDRSGPVTDTIRIIVPRL